MNSPRGLHRPWRSRTTDISVATLSTKEEEVLNLDFQHQYRWKQRQNLVWGMSVYDSAVTTNGGLAVSFNPPDVTVRLFGAFAQDEVAIAHDRFYLTVGARLEHDYYNGFGLDAQQCAPHGGLPNTIPFGPPFREQSTRPTLNETAMRAEFHGIYHSQWNASLYRR